MPPLTISSRAADKLKKFDQGLSGVGLLGRAGDHGQYIINATINGTRRKGYDNDGLKESPIRTQTK